MNLLTGQSLNTQPTGLLNTQPMNVLNGYPNIYQPNLLNFQPTPATVAPPVVDDPWSYGDVANDPNDVNTQNVEDMSVADMVSANEMAGVIGMAPGMGLPAAITKSMMSHALSSKGLDTNGQPTDIGNLDGPGYAGGPANGGNTHSGAGTGIGGSGGDGPTGTGGNGGGDPSMGGDGSSGLAGGGFVGYAVDNNPNPEHPNGQPRDNVMLPMNTKEGVLPPDVMEYIGVDGLNEFIQGVRQKAGQTNKAQDQRSMLLG